MQTNKIYLLFLFFSLLVSCQPKEKFDWEIGLSAPIYYSSSPSVRFFYNNKTIHSASSNIGIQPGWGEASGGYASGSESDEIPDSLHVEWLCGTDRYHYQGDFKLPREKMLKLFQTPVTDSDGTMRHYSLIIVGTAPGGNVTVWMRAGNVQTVIAKFKAENKGIWKENDVNFNKYWGNEEENSKYKNTEYNIFHYLHGIPYSVWEKGEKQYGYDVGFTSEDNVSKINILTFYTKSGIIFQPDSFSEAPFTIDESDWDYSNFNPNNNRVKTKPIPIMMKVEVENLKNPKIYHSTLVVLPNDFEKSYNRQYLDSITGKKENFNRIIIGVKSSENNGFVWLEGKNKRIKVMEFKCFLPKMNGTTYESGGYSLPKGFEFPKWEGREKLIKPDIEFWQEK
ncbi:DUF2931 family protein [Flavobacterium sp. Fl-77]|uniref:DUF2931 family protein n=1 Tax=Flavobacterium flavipigmentatum TaxID=2893884 RepID=A0AAJ2SCD4_9FLAO|nr:MULTISPECIES: DUF2931 family protein [unclassified Flavobacterium]MDX6184092.1 DUF2931 family protein [Flavobacterium sp. Fl-33]MDX6187686.1 DUF2931 family protein [Flavobacterium sp. Fl-77]UFH39204.1 DUF2931 family protein [Flavobacterium sp. F-70]